MVKLVATTDVVYGVRAGPCSCGAYFADRKTLSRHRATACPLVPRAERKPRNDNKTRARCPGCKKEMLARDVQKHTRTCRDFEVGG